VFTARYALSPYVKQTRFVFKGLKELVAIPNFKISLKSLLYGAKILISIVVKIRKWVWKIPIYFIFLIHRNIDLNLRSILRSVTPVTVRGYVQTD
jgi:hypothetical protein